MAIFYHGSPNLFDHFELTGAGDGTGLKFGYGVYLTEVEASAVHYSQPRKQEFAQKHYLYTVEIPDLKDGEYLVSAKPVDESIVAAVESKLGVKAPENIKAAGKEFRKWIGTILTGAKKADFIEEKKAELKKEKEELDIPFDSEEYREEYSDDFWEAYRDGYAAGWFTRYEIIESPLFMDKEGD